MPKIKTAVLPVAGFGTRVMPLTLHQPKGMIGIVDRPIIHYVIDEILQAGIRHMVLVISPGHHQFEKYLNYLGEKDPEWRKLNIKFDFVIQKKPWGNGDAVMLAKKFTGAEPFLLAYGDDILAGRKTAPLKRIVELFEKTGAPVIALERVPRREVFRYGVVAAEKSRLAGDLYEIRDLVEKPRVEEAPSDLTVVGRYILTPEIVDRISELYPYQGKEIFVTDALRNHVLAGGKLYGWLFDGQRFDCGSKLGILKAQVYFGKHHKELGPEFRKYLRSNR